MISSKVHSTPRIRSAASAVLALGLMMGCGGGGGDSATANRFAFTQGTITGFGSIIVGGVRFDDSKAQVIDDDDQAHDRGELKLGMTVEIRSDHVRTASSGSGRSADARHIRFGSELVGPATDIVPSTTGGTFKVLAQFVDVDKNTVFEDSLAGGLSMIQPDDIVEVHAQFDTTTGRYLAKRIELEPNAMFFKLRGIVSKLNAPRFNIGDAVINFGGINPAELPNNFAEGLKVRVRLEKAKNIDGEWVAVSIRTGVRKVEDHNESEVRGVITEFPTAGDKTTFKIGDLLVKTDANTKFPNGTTGIDLGARVEVEGAIVDGTLMATKVELEDEHDIAGQPENELHGVIEQMGPAGTNTFMVRGVNVHFDSLTTTFVRGTASDLGMGKAVEVRGKLAADGVTVEATLIKFEL